MLVVSGLTLPGLACGGEPGAGGATALELIEDGVLTVCTDAPHPPYQFEEPDTELGYDGFDIRLVVQLADRLDLQPRVVVTGFERIVSGDALTHEECDLAAAAIAITPERAERLAFSIPYHVAEASVLVAADGAADDLDELDDLQGKRLGVEADSAAHRLATETLDLEVEEVVVRARSREAVTSLRDGEVDAVLDDLSTGVEVASRDAAVDLALVVEGDELALAVARDRPDDLLERVDDVLGELLSDGTRDELVAQWFPALPQ